MSETYDDKVEAVAKELFLFYYYHLKATDKDWENATSLNKTKMLKQAHTLLELALGDIRTIAMRALEDDRDHRNELRSIIPLCPPAPPVKIEWNEASERGFDAKIKRGLVKNVLNNEEDVTKATDQIMQIFAEVSDAPKI